MVLCGVLVLYHQSFGMVAWPLKAHEHCCCLDGDLKHNAHATVWYSMPER